MMKKPKNNPKKNKVQKKIKKSNIKIAYKTLKIKKNKHKKNESNNSLFSFNLPSIYFIPS